MKHETLFPMDLAPLKPVVTVLECSGTLKLDPAPIAHLLAEKGEVMTQETVCCVLEDLTKRIAELNNPRFRAAFSEIDMPAERIGAIADQIGLTEVAAAARHVATAARQRDGIALEATLARLERGFDVAISQVWTVAGAL